jgi:hypothetical protein
MQRMSRRSMPSGLTRGGIRFADKDMCKNGIYGHKTLAGWRGAEADDLSLAIFCFESFQAMRLIGRRRSLLLPLGCRGPEPVRPGDRVRDTKSGGRVGGGISAPVAS